MLAPHGPKQERCQEICLLRKDWSVPPASTSNTPIKIEPQPQEFAIPNATTALKAEKCGWGPNCPICKNIGEDWDGDHQKPIQQSIPSTQAQNEQPQNAQQLQMPGFQCPQAQNYQKTTRFTALPNMKYTAPPATKPPALLVTNIQCTRQIFKSNKTP